MVAGRWGVGGLGWKGGWVEKSDNTLISVLAPVLAAVKLLRRGVGWEAGTIQSLTRH